MKLIHKLYTVLAASAVFFGMAACSPDEYSLGEVGLTKADLKEGVAFEVLKDPTNPNIITLKSKLPSNYQVLWDEPQGRAQGSEVTLKIPFQDTYAFRMGVETRGGILYSDTCHFTVDQFCSQFVDDPLWSYVTGGVGHKKKWYIDLDSKGVSRYFEGPMYFYSTDYDWESVANDGKNLADNGKNDWKWKAGFSDQSWIVGGTADDYGYMEFDLDNGANVTVYDAVKGTTTKGKFMLDTDNHTMKLTDATMLRPHTMDNVVTNWNDLMLLSLTEDHMQLGVIRNNSTEGKVILCYNFISEDYRDNWTPTVSTGNVTPDLITDWRDYVEPKNQNIVTYKLAEDDSPFDWCQLNGTPKGLDVAKAIPGIGDLTLTMNHKDSTYTVTTPDGESIEGKYELSDNGIYTFKNGLPRYQLSSNGLAMFKANADKTLRVLKVSLDKQSNGLSDLWLGSVERDDQGNATQYMGYHFQPYVAGSTVKKYSATLTVNDNSSWIALTSDVCTITQDGTYTCTVYGAKDQEGKIIYLQIDKLLRDHPNADIIVKDIKVDGKSIAFDDATINRCVGDLKDGPSAKYNARRYFISPWGTYALKSSDLTFSKSFAVTFEVKFDTGSVKIK